MLQKPLLIALIICFVFSVSVFASVDLVSYINFTAFSGGYYSHNGFGVHSQKRFAIMGSVNRFSTFIGSLTVYDLLGGFKFKFTPLLSDYPTDNTILGGVRFGAAETGFLIKFLSRQDYTERWFSSGDVELLVWPEGDTALKTNYMVGYQIVDEFSVKGGVNSLLSGGSTAFGLSIGIESRF